MIGVWRRFGAGRGCAITLAALAILIQVCVPQGYMVRADRAVQGLVICTGHGAFSLATQDNHGKAPKSVDSACAFALHGALGGAPTPIRIAGLRIEAETEVAARLFDLAPGRGLAAPPPPSQGPPEQI